MIETILIKAGSGLANLVREINQADWDSANEMSPHDEASLATYLEKQDTLFVACHALRGDSKTLLGIASARVQMKPYVKELWLYIDEVDVCADQRRKGAGQALMKKLFEIAREAGCQEVWLGAETDNVPANALYNSLKPDDAASFVGYSYEVTVDRARIP